MGGTHSCHRHPYENGAGGGTYAQRDIAIQQMQILEDNDGRKLMK